jgi:hypothetical protein
MANTEVITCDYAGCTKPFAYRIKGFNLCAEHAFIGIKIKDLIWKEGRLGS